MKQQAFLGVWESLSGRRWLGPSPALERAADALMQQADLAPQLARVLARRNVMAQDVSGFLAPALRDLMPDPRQLRDATRAANRLNQAVRGNERIAIFADYDVDGGCSAALLIWWLRAQNRSATLYVPDRIDEGYGPNPPAISQLAQNHDLIICVDCGTLSHEALGAAGRADVIVLDHHLGAETLPPALAVVNPNRMDEDGALGHLCAAGVVFLVLVEAGRLLRSADKKGPDLLDLLDLVALATVADVAPLIGVNRAFVRQGLRVMARRARPGLMALADGARLDTAPTAYHLGYVLGPRINAGGRIGRADLGARLLASSDENEAAALAGQLETLNLERRDIEADVRAQALAQAEARGLDGPLTWAVGDAWHPGVVGIVAARLKEHANRPAIVIGVQDGIGKGSGRSVLGVDLGAAIQRLASEGLLIKGGGHKMAAGLTVAQKNIEPAMDRLSALLAQQGEPAPDALDLRIDGIMSPQAATPELIREIETAGPYGASISAPRYVFADMQIFHTRIVAETHLRVDFGDATGARLQAIAFGAAQGPMGAALRAHAGRRFHLAGRVEINTWKGRQNVQLALNDAALA